jgi:hypothetical protein
MQTTRNLLLPPGRLLPAVLLVLLALCGPVLAADAGAGEQASFPTPDDALAAFVTALRADNVAELGRILGPGSEKLLNSGDKVADNKAREKFVTAYEQKHSLTKREDGSVIVVVGDADWPLPMPLVQSHGRWHFDSAAGAQEIVDRRIGRNEIAAIRVALAYVDAQHDYFDRRKEQTGAGEYAQRLVSREAHHDGLYWPAKADEPESPLGPLVDQAVEEGYPGATSARRMIPYQGYYFRILKAQGANAPGGAREYVKNGRMTEGFALLAWPASYGASGIMTFEVNQDGVVFQKDLGPGTDALARQISRFDPDLSWARVDVTEK